MSRNKLEPVMELEHVDLRSGPQAPLKMPEQDLSAGDSLLTLLCKRLSAARVALLTGDEREHVKVLSKSTRSAPER